MTEPNLFDNTELTVLGELERRLMRFMLTSDNAHENYAYSKALSEINRLKPAEIEKLKLSFAEGGAIPQSAESWVRKFRQG